MDDSEGCKWRGGCWNCLTNGNQWAVLMDNSECCVGDVNTLDRPIKKVVYKEDLCRDKPIVEATIGWEIVGGIVMASVILLVGYVVIRWIRGRTDLLSVPLLVRARSEECGTLDVNYQEAGGRVDSGYGGLRLEMCEMSLNEDTAL